MTLAVMLAVDVDAFVCDLAETYHILDYRALPVEMLAVLASGLRDDSRIKMKMSGFNYVPLQVLAAHCVDTLALILYVLSADKNTSKPNSMLDIITGKQQKEFGNGFETVEEFEAARRRIIAGV